jgi:hypothetical protein
MDPNRNRGPWCAVCGAEKRSENHWFLLSINSESLVLQPLVGRLVPAGWEPLCGERCVHQRVSEWLKGGV